MTRTATVVNPAISVIVLVFTAFSHIGLSAVAQENLSNKAQSSFIRGGISEHAVDVQSVNETPRLAPSIATSLLKAGISKFQAGDTVAAEQLFKSVLRRDANNADAYFNLGVIAEKRSDLPDALHYYKEAIRIQPDDTQLQAAVSQLTAKLNTENYTFSENHITQRIPGTSGIYVNYQYFPHCPVCSLTSVGSNYQYQNNSNQDAAPLPQQKPYSSSTKRLIFAGLRIGLSVASHGGGCGLCRW